MTPEETRGRRITLVIALVVGAPAVLMSLLLALLPVPKPGFLWLQLGVSMILSVLLYKGYGWARAYISFSLAVGAVWLTVGPLFTGNAFAFVFGLPFAVVYFAAASALWKSKEVDAYFDGQKAVREPVLSLKDLNDV